MSYVRRPVSAPRLSGLPLELLAQVVEGPLGRAVLTKLTHDSGLGDFRAAPVNEPALSVPYPHPAPPQRTASAREWLEHAVGAPPGGPFETVADFAHAYRAGRLTPTEVARRALDAMRASDVGPRPLKAFLAVRPDDVLAQAEASTQRFRDGRPLGPLDGVPVAVKDELDQVPFPTTLGTRFFDRPATHDATVVARLRGAGALLLGKTNMHEVGINPIGINPHHGAVRNPYDRSRISGGSSSGSAAAVGAGLCPLSIGADGGGSVRIPAALCGVVGLKATFARISEHGVPPLCWSVGHVGPLGATVADVAAAYAVIAGADPDDPGTRVQPAPHLERWNDPDLSGVRLGVAREHFQDGDPELVRAAERALGVLVEAGAKVVDVPPPEMNTLLWSHTILILSEMASAMRPYVDEDSTRFGLDTRVNLAIGRYFASADYVHALRHRRRILLEQLELFRTVDAVVTPSTAIAAPPMPEHALPGGESHLAVSDALMRYIRPGNLTGFPALTVPSGYSADGLPLGVHFMAGPFNEALLFQLGCAVERSVERRAAPGAARLLG